MDVASVIERFVFDFGKAGKLAEEAHSQAFEEIFSRLVDTLALWVPADSRMSITLLNMHGPLNALAQDSREIARQLYHSNTDECIIHLSNSTGWTASVRIVMDPILIYFESVK